MRSTTRWSARSAGLVVGLNGGGGRRGRDGHLGLGDDLGGRRGRVHERPATDKPRGAEESNPVLHRGAEVYHTFTVACESLPIPLSRYRRRRRRRPRGSPAAAPASTAASGCTTGAPASGTAVGTLGTGAVGARGTPGGFGRTPGATIGTSAIPETTGITGRTGVGAVGGGPSSTPRRRQPAPASASASATSATRHAKLSTE